MNWIPTLLVFSLVVYIDNVYAKRVCMNPRRQLLSHTRRQAERLVGDRQESVDEWDADLTLPFASWSLGYADARWVGSRGGKLVVAGTNAKILSQLYRLSVGPSSPVQSIGSGQLATHVQALRYTCQVPTGFYGIDVESMLSESLSNELTTGTVSSTQALAMAVHSLAEADNATTHQAVLQAGLDALEAGHDGNYKYRYGIDESIWALRALVSLDESGTLPGSTGTIDTLRSGLIQLVLNQVEEISENPISTALAVQALLLTSTPVPTTLTTALSDHVSSYLDATSSHLVTSLHLLQALTLLEDPNAENRSREYCEERIQDQLEDDDDYIGIGPGPYISATLKVFDDTDSNTFGSEGLEVGTYQITVNATILQLMRLVASDGDNEFSFQTTSTQFGASLVAVNGLTQNPGTFSYWTIYYGPGNSVPESTPTGIETFMIPEDGVVELRYKSFA